MVSASFSWFLWALKRQLLPSLKCLRSPAIESYLCSSLQMNWGVFCQTMGVAGFNMTVVTLLHTMALWPLARQRIRFETAELPDPLAIVQHLVVCLIVVEAGFYYQHRLVQESIYCMHMLSLPLQRMQTHASVRIPVQAHTQVPPQLEGTLCNGHFLLPPPGALLCQPTPSDTRAHYCRGAPLHGLAVVYYLFLQHNSVSQWLPLPPLAFV